VIRQDDDVASTEPLAMRRTPLLRTHRVRRRRQPEGAEAVDVLLPLDNEDRSVRLGQQLPEAIQQVAVAGLPLPAAATVRPALTETLRLVASDLERQLAVSGPVVVDRDDLARRIPVAALGREQVGHRDAERVDDLLGLTPRVAIEEHAAVVALSNAQRRLGVVV